MCPCFRVVHLAYNSRVVRLAGSIEGIWGDLVARFIGSLHQQHRGTTVRPVQLQTEVGDAASILDDKLEL